MKQRWFVALGVFLLAALILLPPIAADLDLFFSRQYACLIWEPLKGWQTVGHGGKALRFYLLLIAATALGLLWILLSEYHMNFRSGQQVVTPDIITPKADGQGQHGTARWLTPYEFERYFSIWTLPIREWAFQALIKAGDQDYKEAEEYAKQHSDAVK